MLSEDADASDESDWPELKRFIEIQREAFIHSGGD
jgi:hypothetical protein